jgi:gluconolactonase
MRLHWVSGLVIAGIAVALAQTQTGSSGSVARLDPGLDAIVPAKATIERVAGGFKWPEGPVWVHSGFLFFSEIPSAVIDKWTPDGKVTTYLGPAEFTMKDVAAAAVPGTNGLTLDKQGRLTICDQGNRRITRLEKDGHFTMLADRYQGKRFNSPNDLVYKSDGSLYFTDPPYALEKQDDDPKKELPFNGVFRIAGGKVTLLIRDLTRPNGIAFSPDEHYLYVDNSEPQRLYMRYEVKPNETLGPGKVFYDLASTPGKNLPDGMKVDQKGNVYATGPGGIWIFSPEGKHLGTVRLPEIASNCAWGDPDGKTLYITASTGLYRIHLNIPGIRP